MQDGMTCSLTLTWLWEHPLYPRRQSLGQSPGLMPDWMDGLWVGYGPSWTSSPGTWLTSGAHIAHHLTELKPFPSVNSLFCVGRNECDPDGTDSPDLDAFGCRMVQIDKELQKAQLLGHAALAGMLRMPPWHCGRFLFIQSSLSLMADTIIVIMPSPQSPCFRSHCNHVCSDMYHRPPPITFLYKEGLGNQGQHSYCSTVLPWCSIQKAHPIACLGHNCMTGGLRLQSYSVDQNPNPYMDAGPLGTFHPGHSCTSMPLFPSPSPLLPSSNSQGVTFLALFTHWISEAREIRSKKMHSFIQSIPSLHITCRNVHAI